MIGSSTAAIAPSPLTQAVGSDQPQQHPLAQAAVGDDHVRRRPDPGNRSKYSASRQHELDPIRSHTRMQHEPFATERPQMGQSSGGFVTAQFDAIHSDPSIPFQIQGNPSQRGDGATR